MPKPKLHIGMMFITERNVGVIPQKRHVMGNYVLLLLDGSTVNSAEFPTLARLLHKAGYGDRLPNEYQEDDILDSYIVARRLRPVERKALQSIGKQKDGNKK